jgi:hypothetical protein
VICPSCRRSAGVDDRRDRGLAGGQAGGPAGG